MTIRTQVVLLALTVSVTISCLANDRDKSLSLDET